MTTSYRFILVLTGVVILLLGYNFINAWTVAPGTPPGNNVSAPVNISSSTQNKLGNLSASIFAATTEMRSNRYCDALGGNCFSATSSPGGGGSTITVDGQCFEPTIQVTCNWNWGGSGNDDSTFLINTNANPQNFCTSVNRVYMRHNIVLAECGIGDYAWDNPAWSACSAVAPNGCGYAYGTQTRTVSCRRLADNAVVADSFCSGTKPAASQACTVGYKCPGDSCFTAETKVTMADGQEKLIKDVVIGDKVKGEAGAVNTVLAYDRPMLGDRLLYSINNGPYFVTAEHPFKTTAGWQSISPEELLAEDPSLAKLLQPTELMVGAEIINEDGSVTKITSIKSQTAPDQLLYNLVLDGNNTYFVNGLLTHNKF